MTTDELQRRMLASPATAGLAWTYVREKLINWGLGEAARHDARIILTELISNAVAVTPMAETITVRCARDPAGIVIGVCDPCPDIPQNPEPVVELEPGDLDLDKESWDDNGGWGLTMVKALSADCGVNPHPSGVGKTVWARLVTS